MNATFPNKIVIPNSRPTGLDKKGEWPIKSQPPEMTKLLQKHLCFQGLQPIA
jgi:hypothetical protein